MTTKRKNALTLGTLAGTLVLSGAAFAVTPLASGYMGDGKHGEGSCGVKSMDKNADGKISKAEFAAAHDGKAEKFASHDLNSDGFITQAEMDKAHAAMAEKKDAKAAEGKCGEGKCGEGKCGAKPAKATGNDAKAGEGKCGEGKCGEGKCGGSL